MKLHLVRHASAGRRSPGVADLDRPLDDSGRAQAATLSELLSPGQPMQVLSSPALRCRQTIEPLATALDLRIDVSDDLAEGQSERHAVAMLHRLVTAGVSAVLCTHADIIPRVLDALAVEGVTLAGTGCAKASVWTLTVSDGRISDGRYRPTV